MMRASLREWESSDWFLMALGGGAGLTWALVSIVVGVQWWNTATVPWWAGILRAVLLWPLFAAFYAPLRGADVFVLTFAIGDTTGIIGGLLLVWLSWLPCPSRPDL